MKEIYVSEKDIPKNCGECVCCNSVFREELKNNYTFCEGEIGETVNAILYDTSENLDNLLKQNEVEE